MNEKQNARHELYGTLNKLYSANFSCRRISKQDTTNISSGVHTGSEIFSRSTSERWVSKKLEDISDLRNHISSDLESAIFDEKDAYILMEHSLNECIDSLVTIYNLYFETEKTYDDLFDGFVCKDETLSKYIESYDLQSTFITPNPEVMYMMNTYDYYMDMLEKNMVLTALKEISEKLTSDISRYGMPVKNANNNENPNITTLDKEDLDIMFRFSRKISKSITSEEKSLNKKLIPLYRKKKKKNVTYKDKCEIDREISKIKTLIFNANTKHKKCDEFISFLNELKERFECANKDYFSHPISTITEGICDVLAGTPRKKIKVDEFYIHSLELSFIDYFITLLSGDYSKPYDKRSTTMPEKKEEQIFDI